MSAFIGIILQTGLGMIIGYFLGSRSERKRLLP